MNMKEASKTLELPASTILYYEKRGLLTPRRKTNRYRDYSPDDIRQLKMIYLMREFHFSIDEIRQILHWNQKDTHFKDHNKTAKEFFIIKKEEINKQIRFLQKTLEIIDHLPVFSTTLLEGEQKYKVITELTNQLFIQYQEKDL